MKNSYQHNSDSRGAEDKALERFAELMIRKIETIRGDWQKPWFTNRASWPRNIYDGKYYDGLNALMLSLHCEEQGYTLPVFGTFERYLSFNYKTGANGEKQPLLDSEGNPMPKVTVNKGEKSFPLYFTSFTVVHRETKEKIKWEDYKKLSRAEQADYRVYPKTQVWPVFAIEQTNMKEARPDLWRKFAEQDTVRNPVKSDGPEYALPVMDRMIADGTWVCPVRVMNQNGAYFNPSNDTITLPEKEQFLRVSSGEHYYGTAFHEMVHSTGHESRLGRLKLAPFGSPEYAREELVAELGSALIAQKYGISRVLDEQNAKYLKSWIGCLGESPDYIRTVLNDMKKATSMVTRRLDAIQTVIDAEQARDVAYKAYDEYSFEMSSKYGPEYYDRPDDLVKLLTPDESAEMKKRNTAYMDSEKILAAAKKCLEADMRSFSQAESEEVQKTELKNGDGNSVRIVSQKFAVEPGDGWIDKLDMIGEAAAVSQGNNESESENPDESWYERYDTVSKFIDGLAVVSKGDKWGFINPEGQEVVPCQYQEVCKFSEGLAAVQNDGMYGYTDKSGHEVIPCQYDYAYPFSEGLAIIEKSGKCGFIDPTGTEAIPCQYDNAEDFSGGYACVEQDGEWGYIDQQGKEIIPCQHISPSAAALALDKRKQEQVSSNCFDRYTKTMKLPAGSAIVKNNNLFGYVDSSGHEVIPCQYDYVAEFSEGLAVVLKDGRYGYIDSTGNEVIPCQYEYAYDFQNGHAPVCNAGKWGAIDTSGNEIIPIKYDLDDVFSNFLDVSSLSDGHIQTSLPQFIQHVSPSGISELYLNASSEQCLQFLRENSLYIYNGNSYVDAAPLASHICSQIEQSHNLLLPNYNLGVQEPHIKVLADAKNDGKYVVNEYQDKMLQSSDKGVSLLAATERVAKFTETYDLDRAVVSLDRSASSSMYFIKDGDSIKDVSLLAKHLADSFSSGRSEVHIKLSEKAESSVFVSVRPENGDRYALTVSDRNSRSQVFNNLGLGDVLTTIYEQDQIICGNRQATHEHNNYIADSMSRSSASEAVRLNLVTEHLSEDRSAGESVSRHP